jgi:RNA recognition motif-containing protein
VILPTRYKNRPAGYAFVTYKNEADATKAVESLNETGTSDLLSPPSLHCSSSSTFHCAPTLYSVPSSARTPTFLPSAARQSSHPTEIGGRQVHLQLARSKEENAERRTALLEQRKEAKAAKVAKAKEAKEEKEAADTTAVDSEKSADKADKPKKKKKAAPKQSRRRRPEDGDETAVDEAEAEAAPKAAKPKKAKEPKPKAENGDAAEKEPKEPKERKPRLALTGEVSKVSFCR